MLRLLPLAAVGVVILVAVATIIVRSKNVTRSDLLRIFKAAKPFEIWVLVLTMLFSGTFGLLYHYNAKNYVYAVVSLNYSDASRALNSNGTRFNMAEMVCDEVIEKAIKQGAFEDVTVNDLKRCLEVYPYVQGGVGNESEYHISTEFIISYYASKKTMHLDAENVIKLVASAYKEYYVERYTDSYKSNILDDEVNFDDMEYMDIVLYFNKEASSLLNYVYGLSEKNSSFVTSNNSTFSSISGKIYQFKKTQIEENLRSLILQQGITRDKTEYIDRLSYRNKNTEFDKKRNAASFKLCNKAIAMYSEEMTRVVLVPTWDESGKYYMGRTKVGIDELSVMATDYSDKVAQNEKTIMDNELIIEKIEDTDTKGDGKHQADELIASIDESLRAFRAEVIAAGREFSNYTMNQCISLSVNGHSIISDIKAMIVFAVFAYLAFILLATSRRIPKK